MDAAEVAAVTERGTLADGTPWPVPVTLDVPAGAAPADASHLVLQDPEGSPLAVLAITERLALPAGDDPGLVRLAGPVTALREPEHGPFRQLRRHPADVRAELAGPDGSPGGNVLGYATRRPLNRRHIGQLRHYAGQLNARLLILPLVCGPAEIVTRPEALVRAVLAARQHLPAGTLVVPVPLAPRGAGRARGPARRGHRGRGLRRHPPAGRLIRRHGRAGRDEKRHADAARGADPGHQRGRVGVRPALGGVAPAGADRAGCRAGRADRLRARRAARFRGRGAGLARSADVARELRRARPPRAERGLAIFFTGLSGSGKSTIARGLAEALTERGDRTVSLLDGDHVRRLLSAGLTFSRADRDLNIARIGYVAAEVARHGGIAICAPIAPYAEARAAARRMVTEVGDFLLVYVSTPVDVCAARDRKGLYAKARAGLITGFTGVSDPYEEPRDADLVLDTSVMTRQEAVDAVLKLLVTGGWLAGQDELAETGGAAAAGLPQGERGRAPARPVSAAGRRPVGGLQSWSSARAPSSSLARNPAARGRLPFSRASSAPDMMSRCRDSSTKLAIPLTTKASASSSSPRAPTRYSRKADTTSSTILADV